jgi:hypothetical protein
MVVRSKESPVSKLKKVLSVVVDASTRPTETWRFLRQAVREVRVVLQGVATLVGELEERLDRLEAAAMRPAASTATSGKPARPHGRKPAPRAKPAARRAAKKRTRKPS